MSRALDFTANLDRKTVPAQSKDTALKCHFKIRPSAKLNRSVQSGNGTSICLVFDCSTSMMGRRLQVAIDSAKMIVDTIDQRHLISLVAFQANARLLVDSAQATETEKSDIKRRIDQIQRVVGGSTNMSEGIGLGTKTIKDHASDAKVMVILSDGAANSPDDAQKAAIEATRAGIQVFAVGIGAHYEAGELLKLVRPSNGAVFGESDAEKIKSVFSHLIGRIENFVATNARIELRPRTSVRPGKAYKTMPEQGVIGNLPSMGGDRLQLNVGNLERYRTYGFIWELAAPNHKPGKVDLFDAKLIYDVPALRLRDQEELVRVSVGYTDDQETAAAVDQDVVDAYRGANMAQMLDSLQDAYDENDRVRLARTLRALVERCDDDGDEGRAIQFEGLLRELSTKNRVSKESLNACLVADSAAADEELDVEDDVEELEAKPVETEPPSGDTPEAQDEDEDEIEDEIEDEDEDDDEDGDESPEPPAVEAVAAPPPLPTEELFDLVLVDVGATPIRVVREIRNATGLGLREISRFTKTERASIREAITFEQANELRSQIEAAGAQLEVARHIPAATPDGASTPAPTPSSRATPPPAGAAAPTPAKPLPPKVSATPPPASQASDKGPGERSAAAAPRLAPARPTPPATPAPAPANREPPTPPARPAIAQETKTLPATHISDRHAARPPSDGRCQPKPWGNGPRHQDQSPLPIPVPVPIPATRTGGSAPAPVDRSRPGGSS